MEYDFEDALDRIEALEDFAVAIAQTAEEVAPGFMKRLVARLMAKVTERREQGASERADLLMAAVRVLSPTQE